MNHATKLINELRDALVEVTDRLEAYRNVVLQQCRDDVAHAMDDKTARIIAAARVAIDKATTT